ncbi:hypothetical protein NUW58_g5474 [Xylaria curta]|uniref:Uncharacterized protein n=1 Tax=Xylaria curta TaxID=42375 RepID=A0ACC1P2J3_9PEZI|nr:hypothetical protein NUW58_g5474 [Xylaria curta]
MYTSSTVEKPTETFADNLPATLFGTSFNCAIDFGDQETSELCFGRGPEAPLASANRMAGHEDPRLVPTTCHVPATTPEPLYATIYRVRMIPAGALLPSRPYGSGWQVAYGVPVLVPRIERRLAAARAAPHQGSGPAAEFSVVLTISFRE